MAYKYSSRKAKHARGYYTSEGYESRHGKPSQKGEGKAKRRKRAAIGKKESREQTRSLFGNPAIEKNLFGFGSKLQSSSRLEKQAYDAGYRGVDGWHGTHYFDAWLKGQGDKKEWSGRLVSRLKAEYKRGGVEYEADRLLEKAKAQGKVKTGGKEDKPVKYKGHRIVPVGGGEWTIPDVDRESRFESLAEAKRFVMANPKRRRNSGPIESTVSGVTSTGKSVGRYLDSQLGKALGSSNPKTKLDLMLDKIQSTGGEITFDVRDYTQEQKQRVEDTARGRGFHVSGDGKYILVRPAIKSNPTQAQFAYLENADDHNFKSLATSYGFEIAGPASSGSFLVKDGDKAWLFGPLRKQGRITIRTVTRSVWTPSNVQRMSNPGTRLTQGDAVAYITELDSGVYVAEVIAPGGTREEKEFKGRGGEEAAKAWARLVLFEVAKAGVNSNPRSADSPIKKDKGWWLQISGGSRGTGLEHLIGFYYNKKEAEDAGKKIKAAGYTPEIVASSRFNPAASPEQYRLAQAVLSGTARGAHMPVKVAREIVEKTPAAMRSEYSRYKHNPESSSMDMYSSFHGRPSRETVEITETIHDHDNVAALGTCCGFLIVAGSKQFAIGLSGYTWSPRADGPGKKKGGFVKTDPAADDVFLSSNEEGTQMFVDGGDQELDLSSLGITGREAEKEAIVIGDVAMVAYETEKEFDKFDLIQYVHTLSEDSKGPLPVLRYMRRNSKGARMFLDGGVYYIEKPLVGTSPGIED